MPTPVSHFAVPPAPGCYIVTGASGPAKSRWMTDAIAAVHAEQPSAQFAILSSNDSAAAMERFANTVPRISVCRLNLPCLCCPANAGLPPGVRALTSNNNAGHLFIEMPALATIGLLAEFDQFVRWPREIVACLDARWAGARRTGALSFFQSRLLSFADRVVEVSTTVAGMPLV